jgi:hypothetical protein
MCLITILVLKLLGRIVDTVADRLVETRLN